MCLNVLAPLLFIKQTNILIAITILLKIIYSLFIPLQHYPINRNKNPKNRTHVSTTIIRIIYFLILLILILKYSFLCLLISSALLLLMTLSSLINKSLYFETALNNSCYNITINDINKILYLTYIIWFFIFSNISPNLLSNQIIIPDTFNLIIIILILIIYYFTVLFIFIGHIFISIKVIPINEFINKLIYNHKILNIINNYLKWIPFKSKYISSQNLKSLKLIYFLFKDLILCFYCDLTSLLKLTFGYFLTLCLSTLSIINKFIFEKIKNLKEKQFILLCLKYSLILSMIITYSILKYYNNPTNSISSSIIDIFSFISSVLIIPLILADILDMKNIKQ